MPRSVEESEGRLKTLEDGWNNDCGGESVAIVSSSPSSPQSPARAHNHRARPTDPDIEYLRVGWGGRGFAGGSPLRSADDAAVTLGRRHSGGARVVVDERRAALRARPIIGIASREPSAPRHRAPLPRLLAVAERRRERARQQLRGTGPNAKLVSGLAFRFARRRLAPASHAAAAAAAAGGSVRTTEPSRR